jgi:hypothetical protein
MYKYLIVDKIDVQIRINGLKMLQERGCKAYAVY